MLEEKKEQVTEEAQKNDSRKTENMNDKYELSLESMLKAGLHFGHKKSRWNPKMEKYIFGTREGVHILDLEKTITLFERAMKEVAETLGKGQQIMLVGTKRQAKNLVKAIGEKAEIPYVEERWLGGTFTNFDVIKKRVKFLLENEEALEKGRLGHMTKLERLRLEKKLEKIEESMGGLRKMTQLPELVFVMDAIQDKTVIEEAKKMGIKTVGIIDTNADPSIVDFPIPANDDALSSIKYILGVFLKTVLKTKKERVVATANQLEN
ncbi:MAG TPA: 30S ribosomal protein S2 [Candidatus Moranbacteria bacterium]|nr:30S ribosomal protein S2 [Candidatus Moranbacteria bacterium]